MWNLAKLKKNFLCSCWIEFLIVGWYIGISLLFLIQRSFSGFILFWQSSYGSSPIWACFQHSCINTLFKDLISLCTQRKFSTKKAEGKQNGLGALWMGWYRHLQTILYFRPWNFWTFIQLDDEQLIYAPFTNELWNQELWI